MTKKYWRNRALSIILTMAMVFTLVPAHTLSANTGDTDITAEFSCPNFLKAIREEVGKPEPEPILLSDVEDIENLWIDDLEITSLDGIQRFKNLELLYAVNNELTEVDVTGLEKLEILDVTNNQISKLHISNNPELWMLSAANNILTELTITDTPKLTMLSAERNLLPTLDLSGLQDDTLRHLGLSNNRLTALDISKQSEIARLIIHNNHIEDIDDIIGWQDLLIAGDLDVELTDPITDVKYYDFRFSPQRKLAEEITDDFTCPAFLAALGWELREQGQGPHLERIFESDVKGVTELSLNLYSDITSLVGIHHFADLEGLWVSGNQLTELDVSNLTKLESINAVGNQLHTLSVNKDALINLELDNNKLTELELHDFPELECVNVRDNNIAHLSITDVPKLDTLIFSDNPIENLEISNAPLIKKIGLYHTPLSDLSLVNLPNLTELDLYGTLLTDFDATGLTALETLMLISNEYLANVTVNGLTSLKQLELENNPLMTGLDVGGLMSLEKLAVHSTSVTEITNLGDLISLKEFYADGAKFSSLIIKDLPALEKIDLSYNPLTSLELINLPCLNHAYIDNTVLTGLDLTKLNSINPMSRLVVNNNFMKSPDCVIGWRDHFAFAGDDWFDPFLFYPQRKIDEIPDDNDNGNNQNKNNQSSADDGGTGPQTSTVNSGAVSLNVTKTGNKVVVDLPAAKINELISNADNDTVIINLSGVGGATNATVPANALNQMANAGMGLSVNLPQGTVKLDNDALASLVTQAGANITLSLTKINFNELTPAQREAVKENDLVFSISLLSGDKKITNFDGSLTITLPYDGPLPAAVWFLNTAGDLIRKPSTYDPLTRTVTFTTNHLSIYVIGLDTARTMYVNVRRLSRLNIRQAPTTRSAIIGRLNRDTAVQVIEIKNGWALIEFNGNFAYLAARYLR